MNKEKIYNKDIAFKKIVRVLHYLKVITSEQGYDMYSMYWEVRAK